MLLVDTSAWIEVFRSPPGTIPGFPETEEILTCLPVIEEVLQGFRDERAYRTARESLLSFPILESPLRDAVFLEAAELYRGARRAGLTIRSAADCLIAACALRHDVVILHVDRDYDALAKVSSLRVAHL